jgi:hypothetical protein
MATPSLVSSSPANIQRLLKTNDKINEACEYAKSIRTGSIVADWHEAPSAKPATAAAKSVVQHKEAVMERQHLQERRKLRLKQLLERERLALEHELQQRGLALQKVRD